MRRTIVGMGLAGAMAALGVMWTTAPAQAAGEPSRYVVIMHGQGQGSTGVDAAVANAGGGVTGRIDEIGVLTVTSDRADFAALLKADARVQFVVDDVEVQFVPDVKPVALSEDDVHELGVNSETFNAYLWNIRAIGANLTAAQNIQGNTAKRARVAVLDSGVWDNHPDFGSNVNAVLGQSYVTTSAEVDTNDDGVPDTTVPAEPDTRPVVNGFNHGTHVSGIIAAAINNRGTQGVAPAAEIVPFKVLRSTTGSGSFVWVANGIVDAANIDADIINMSLGATFARPLAGGYGPYVAMLTRAINYATQQGTLVVVAAGNEGVDLDSIFWSVPAQLGNGIAVSATGPEGLALYGEASVNVDRFASYSNYGVSVVNVAAPGGDFSLYPNSAYVFDMVLSPGGTNATGTAWSYYFAAGTSMAAPHVAGLAALIVGEYGSMPPAQLKALIHKSAVDLYKPGADPWSGKGRIDAARAFGLR